MRRDRFRQDGLADLLTLDSSGTLAFQQDDGRGAFAGKVSGGGWSTKVVAVPFGDLNGDRCDDVLVRMSDGSLRDYKVPCGRAPTPATPYTKLGGGWNASNVLASPGDLTGDGRPDPVARKTSTGDVYLFAAKSDGTLAAAKKIGSAWGGYTKIVDAGDLDGDGIGTVRARDKAGTLWRYGGTAVRRYGGTGTAVRRSGGLGVWGSGGLAVRRSGSVPVRRSGGWASQGPRKGLHRLGIDVQHGRRRRRHHRGREERPGRTGLHGPPLPLRRQGQWFLRRAGADRERLAGLQGAFLAKLWCMSCPRRGNRWGHDR